jgi:hypothetical protein
MALHRSAHTLQAGLLEHCLQGEQVFAGAASMAYFLNYFSFNRIPVFTWTLLN